MCWTISLHDRSAGVSARTNAASSPLSGPMSPCISRTIGASSIVWISPSPTVAASPSYPGKPPSRDRQRRDMLPPPGCRPSFPSDARWVQPKGLPTSAGTGGAGLKLCLALGFLAVVEDPFEGQLLPLGVAHDPLAVASELGVVRRQQDQTGQHPVAELVDHVRRPVVALDLPVRRDRAEIHDAHVADGLELLTLFDNFVLGVRGHRTSWHFGDRRQRSPERLAHVLPGSSEIPPRILTKLLSQDPRTRLAPALEWCVKEERNNEYRLDGPGEVQGSCTGPFLSQ